MVGSGDRGEVVTVASSGCCAVSMNWFISLDNAFVRSHDGGGDVRTARFQGKLAKCQRLKAKTVVSRRCALFNYCGCATLSSSSFMSEELYNAAFARAAAGS